MTGDGRWKTMLALIWWFFVFFFCVIVSIIVNGFFFLLMQKENSLLINMLTLTVCSSVGLLLFITKFNELQ